MVDPPAAQDDSDHSTDMHAALATAGWMVPLTAGIALLASISYIQVRALLTQEANSCFVSVGLVWGAGWLLPSRVANDVFLGAGSFRR